MSRSIESRNSNHATTGQSKTGKQTASVVPIKTMQAQKTSNAMIDIRAEQLRGHLVGKLPFNKLSSAAKEDKDQLMDSYLHSLNKVEQMRCDIAEFVKSICAVNVEVRVEDGQLHQSFNDKLVAAKVNDMVAQSNVFALPCRNELTAKLAAHPVEMLAQVLSAALNDAASKVIAELRDSISSLMQHQVVGKIEWHADDICDFKFYRELIVQEVDHQHREVQTELFLKDGTPLANDDPHQKRRQVQKTIVTNALEIKHASAQHEHHVVHVKVTPIANATVMIPENVQRFLKKTPVWIRPFLKIVEGKLIKEEVVERDHQREHHQLKHVERTETRVLPAVWERYTDPAVVLGNAVLTGWSPSEAAAEKHQKEQDDRATQLKSTEDDSFIVSGTALFFAAVCLWSRNPDPAIPLLGLAMLAAGGWYGVKGLWTRFQRG